MSKVPKHIANLISSGENQRLDFKFEISSAQKIAKTLVAFSNTEGGTLLVGVKDNGTIAGIRTDEEIFMIDSAAKMYSRPKIDYTVVQWDIEGKQILEIIIKPGKTKPYFAKDSDNKWKSYIRVNDQNFLADEIYIRYQKEKNKRKVELQYKRQIEFLMDYLEDFKKITLKDFCQRAEIPQKQAENILVDLMILDIIEISFEEKENSFKLKSQ